MGFDRRLDGQGADGVELYFLSPVEAPLRVLVLTNAALYHRMCRHMTGRLVDGVTIAHVPLPTDVARLASVTTQSAVDER